MKVSLHLKGMPEVIWELRREMAALLEEAARAEADPRVARRLQDVATAFTMGARPDVHAGS